jgi:phosphonate transport system substrate-binding protein
MLQRNTVPRPRDHGSMDLGIALGSNSRSMGEQSRPSMLQYFPSRRTFAGGLISLSATALLETPTAESSGVLKFGLTPVFLTNDIDLLAKLQHYLSRQTGREVQLVRRRTYEEITNLLLSGELNAAWICGYPLVQYPEQLALVAVPLWNHEPLYRSYLITAPDRRATGIDDLQGDIHAFSDPNSNSGYLVTAALLAERRLRPEQFFRRTFYTYGHRNVIRAVASGLAKSGSVDGYVWEVVTAIEPNLEDKTKVIRKSELLGFPPVACLASRAGDPDVVAVRRALVSMSSDDLGRDILKLLRLDGFAEEPFSLFDPIAAKMRLVRSLSS